MPFTPYHFGATVAFIGMSMILHLKQSNHLKKEQNVAIYIAMLVGSVIPDLQGFYSIFFNPSIPLHGFSHTLLGAICYSLICSSLQYFIFNYQKMGVNYTLLYLTWLGSILLFHIIPDMFIYPDLHIFAPFSSFNIGRIENYSKIASILSIMMLIGVILMISWYYLGNDYNEKPSKIN